MTVRIGYLLPTRELCMAGDYGTASILALADRAEALGLDSVWIGDSLLAKPRHEPLAMLAAIAGRTRRLKLGTAVLLPVLRNPVLLAHQVATIDQISEGRLILGVGIARDLPAIRAEFAAAGVPFEGRIGGMLEGLQLCRALWSGKPVSWEGRWSLKDAKLAPRPFSEAGPPIWGGGDSPGALKRAGEHFDGWFPSGAQNPAAWRERWAQVIAFARDAARDASAMTGAAYLTLSVDDDAARASAELDRYLAQYYEQPAAEIRAQQYCFAGSRAAATEWLREFVAAGATHFVLRFTGDHERQMVMLAEMRADLS